MIALFDSGMGGITVLREALDALPCADFLYYADTVHVPYGSRPRSDVAALVDAAVKRIYEACDVQALLLACNTATSVSVASLRKIYDFPIIGMEPAVKPAVEHENSRGKRVLVLATELTLKEKKFSGLVSLLDPAGIVDSVALPRLVEFVENSVLDGAGVVSYLRESFSHVNTSDYGTVVLGCTHFPFFRTAIKAFFPEGTDVIDGNAGTVRQLMRVSGITCAGASASGTVSFLSSGELERDRARFDRLLKTYSEDLRP